MDHIDAIKDELDHGYHADLDIVPSCPHSKPYVIIDTETTGTNYNKDKVVQIAAIRYDTSGQPIKTFCTYLYSDVPITPEAFQVNHITADILRDAPTPQQVEERFLAFLGDDLLVGYNPCFDLRMLESTFPGHFSGRQYVDVQSFVSKDALGIPNKQLSTVAAALGYAPKVGFHDAFGDCETVAAVLSALDAVMGGHIRVFGAQAPQVNDHGKATRKKPIPPTAEILSAKVGHPFFGKTMVFTGELSFDRAVAEQMVTDLGALVRTSVSTKTDYLVVGRQDPRLVGSDGLSGKQEKAIQLNLNGKAHIVFLNEAEFFDLLHSGEEALPHV